MSKAIIISEYLRRSYLTNTGKDTVIVTFGTLVNAVTGGLFFVLAPRFLGPQEYGVFATVISTVVLLVTIANFGIDTGILRFARSGSKDFSKILSIAFKAYILLGLVVAVLGIVLAPVISELIKSEASTSLLRIGFCGSILILLTNFFVATLQAKKDFLKASLVNIVGNLARLIILVLSIWFLSINLYWLTAIFFLTPIISVIFGFLMTPVRIQSTTGTEGWSFFKFNSWIALALVVSSVPYDNYFLINLAGPAHTGVYAAPFKLLTFAYAIGGNFTRVLASRYSSFDTSARAKSFSLKVLPIVFLFSAVLLITIPFAPQIIKLLFTEAYYQSVSVYQILAVGFIFFLMSTVPSSVIIYFLGKSQISFYITVAKYIVFLTLMAALVPSQQAVGAAIAYSISESVAFLLMGLYVYTKLRTNA